MNIVGRLKEVKIGEDEVTMVLEYMSMNLKSYLLKLPDRVGLETKTLKSYIFQVRSDFVFKL